MRVIGRCLVALAAVLLSAGTLTAGAAPALADEAGESDEAKVLVLQAVALIVNMPDNHEAVEERIEDALGAEHKEGVDLALVERAAAAVEDEDLAAARDLLQRSIGAGPFVGDREPKEIGGTYGEPGQPAFAVGSESGTQVVLDEFRPDRGFGGGNLVLLALSIAAVAAGALLTWRLRPPDTVRSLRGRATAGSAGGPSLPPGES